MNSLTNCSSLSLIVILMPALKYEMKHEVTHSYINHILFIEYIKTFHYLFAPGDYLSPLFSTYNIYFKGLY